MTTGRVRSEFRKFQIKIVSDFKNQIQYSIFKSIEFQVGSDFFGYSNLKLYIIDIS